MLTLVPDAPSQAVDDLVSAFERALDAVKSTQIDAMDGSVRMLIAELDALGGQERDQVAHAVTQLWDAFNDRFDGLAGFLAAQFHERYAYVKQLERACERMAPYRYSAAAHYYRSTVLMLAYMKAVSQQQSLGSRVVEAVHRGRVLSREGSPAQGAETVMQVSLSVVTGSPRVANLAASGAIA